MAIPAIAPYSLPPLPAESSHAWVLDATRSALLIHDMQNYFVEAFSEHQDPIAQVIPNIQQLLHCADRYDMPVYFTAQPPAQSPQQRGLLSDMWGQGIQTEHQAAIIPQLAQHTPRDNHHLITKWRYSAFNRTDLATSLTSQGIDQLIITGVYGHMGCMISAADAFMNDIQPFLIHDAIADFTQEDHLLASSWVEKRAGKTITTQKAIEQLTRSINIKSQEESSQ